MLRRIIDRRRQHSMWDLCPWKQQNIMGESHIMFLFDLRIEQSEGFEMSA